MVTQFDQWQYQNSNLGLLFPSPVPQEVQSPYPISSSTCVQHFGGLALLSPVPESGPDVPFQAGLQASDKSLQCTPPPIPAPSIPALQSANQLIHTVVSMANNNLL